MPFVKKLLYNRAVEHEPSLVESAMSDGELSDSALVELVKHTTPVTQWSTDGSGNMFWESGPVITNINPGLYRICSSEKIGTFLCKQLIFTDKLINISLSDSEKVIKEISKFWTLKSKFLERELIHKRGILMSGDPGSGKTSTIQLIIRDVIDQGGVAIYPHPNTRITSEGLQLIRKIQPDIPICLILEDFETLIERNENENEWLSILDGESQVGNIVFLATTNYISKLDKRFTDRPSRFDTIITVKMPTENMRRQYFLAKEPNVSKEDLDLWVLYTKGLSIAHLKEFIILIMLYDFTPEQARDKLRKMRERDYTEDSNLDDTENEKQKLGF